MTKTKLIATVVTICAFGTSAFAEEVLPTLSQEKMSEYQSAFGKAISESRAALSDPAKGVSEGAKAGHGPSELSNLTKQMRDGLDKPGGRPPGSGPGATVLPPASESTTPPPTATSGAAATGRGRRMSWRRRIMPSCPCRMA